MSNYEINGCGKSDGLAKVTIGGNRRSYPVGYQSVLAAPSHWEPHWYPIRALTVFTDLACMSLGCTRGKQRVTVHPSDRPESQNMILMIVSLSRTRQVLVAIRRHPGNHYITIYHLDMAVGCHPLSTPLPFHLDIFPQHPHIAAVHNVNWKR